MSEKINIFSFFAGAGFLDLGFELSGHFKVVYVNEFHKAFNDVYRLSMMCIDMHGIKWVLRCPFSATTLKI